MSSARKQGTSSRKPTSGTVSSARDRSGGTTSSARAPTSSARSSDRASAFTTSAPPSTGGVTRLDRTGGGGGGKGGSGGGTSSSNSTGRSHEVGRSRSGEGLSSSSKLPPQETLMEIVQKRFVNDVFESAAGKLKRGAIFNFFD
jgi:hypothetical protein